jgi:GntR family transcriptional regulator
MVDAPHQRLAAELRRLVLEGAYPPGSTFPSHRRLAAEYGVGLGAVHLAVAVLRRAGLVEGRPGARLTVAYAPAVRTLTDPDAPWPHEVGEVERGTCPATAALAARLAAPEGTRLHWVREERLDPDGRPAMLLTAWWRGRERRHVRSVSEVHTHLMTVDEASALGLAAGTAALLVERTRLDVGGRPAQASNLVLPADRWRVVL